jgi:cytochrome P450
MNDPERFPDPHRFDPERFVKSGKFFPDERVVPFGVGKRACLGQSLAEKQLYLFFAGILQQVSTLKNFFAVCCSKLERLELTNKFAVF